MRVRGSLQRAVTTALTVVALAFAAGCGGDDATDRDPQSLLEQAAAKPIPSADVRLALDTDVPGFPILGNRLSLTATGPWVADGPGGRPAFDWRATLRGGGQTLPARLSSVDGGLYVDFMGQFYEAGDDLARQIGFADLEAGPEGASLAQLGIEPDRWLTRVKVADGEEIDGERTRAVTGRVVKRAVVEDLLGLVDRERVEGLPEIDDETVDRVTAAIDTARVEVDVDDETYPRRVRAELRFTVPDDVEDTAIESGTVSFELELDRIGETTVDVEPPFQPDPLASLLRFAGVIFGVEEPADIWRSP